MTGRERNPGPLRKKTGGEVTRGGRYRPCLPAVYDIEARRMKRGLRLVAPTSELRSQKGNRGEPLVVSGS